MMELTNKKVLVIGSGISGIGAVELLENKGACPYLYDGGEKATVEAVRAKLPAESKAEVIVGQLPDEISNQMELVVPSPGVPTDTPFIQNFRDRQIPVWGELELAYQCGKGRVIAITGTNGKTTTTSLVGEIMQNFYQSVFVVGNIGTAYTTESLKMNEESVTVAEVSSFQLETVDQFHPIVSAILNVTPDHLNRHHTMENYAAVKQAITKNQTKNDTCILNYDNEYTRAFGEICPAKVVYFSSSQALTDGLYLGGDQIMLAENGLSKALLNVKTDMTLVGMCNYENVMAAIGIAMNAGVPMDCILKTIKEFKAVEHRIEYVATKKGVMYYNDSKGTNVDAAIQGIRAMDRPTVLLGGGYDKGSEYDEWIENFQGKVKYLVLIGATRDKIAECARKHGFDRIIMADTFEEAMEICISKAESGDAVLLSPACASWGMFPNYEVRGKMFKDIVKRIEE